MDHPKASAFISYNWADKPLARVLAAGLEREGYRVWIDEGELRAGDSIVQRVSEAIARVDFLLALVSPASIGSEWCRKEISLAMTGEIARQGITVIPLKVGNVKMPATLVDKLHLPVDPDDADTAVMTLVSHIERHLSPPTPLPPRRRAATSRRPSRRDTEPPGPISITGIDEAGITQPKNDGTRGSALYAVPFQLSSRPDNRWADLVVANWDRPPRWTTMHRPGIARVVGDRIVLDGTTIEEVQNYHLETLKLAVKVTNEQAEQLRLRKQAEQQARIQTEADHHAAVTRAIDQMQFD